MKMKLNIFIPPSSLFSLQFICECVFPFLHVYVYVRTSRAIEDEEDQKNSKATLCFVNIIMMPQYNIWELYKFETIITKKKKKKKERNWDELSYLYSEVSGKDKFNRFTMTFFCSSSFVLNFACNLNAFVEWRLLL